MNHCFHPTGEALMSYPPQYSHRCCHCGAIWVQQVRQIAQPGHGRYAPQAHIFEPPPTDECNAGSAEGSRDV